MIRQNLKRDLKNLDLSFLLALARDYEIPVADFSLKGGFS